MFAARGATGSFGRFSTIQKSERASSTSNGHDLDLCDKNDIKVVYCLKSEGFTDTAIVPGKGWVYGEEQMRELVANPDSRGRIELYRYIDDVVSRYKNARRS